MNTNRVQVIGHRGCALAPENTMAAFRKAVENGCQTIELDVHASQDGVICVAHDETLDRTTDGSGPISQKSWAELQKLDAGSWFSPEYRGERIPRLDQVLDWARGRCQVVVEIKDGPKPPGFLQDLVELIAARQMQSAVSVISFDAEAVKQVERLQPELHTGILYAPEPMIEARATGLKAGALTGACLGAAGGPLGVVAGAAIGGLAGALLGRGWGAFQLGQQIAAARGEVDSALPHWTQMGPYVSWQAHRHEQAMIPYTANHPLLVHGLSWMGADAVITDHPERYTR